MEGLRVGIELQMGVLGSAVWVAGRSGKMGRLEEGVGTEVQGCGW